MLCRNSAYGKLNDKLDESNKGHQLLRKMGWGGAGLGAKEQGIEAPINAGEVITVVLIYLRIRDVSVKLSLKFFLFYIKIF